MLPKIMRKKFEDTFVLDLVLRFELSLFRSRHRRCSIKQVVLKKFAKFTERHLCRSVFFNKIAGLRPVTLLKKIPTQVFFSELREIFNSTFIEQHLRETASVCWDAVQVYMKHFKDYVALRTQVDQCRSVGYPAGICLLKVNNSNARTRCEIRSKLTIKTPKRRQ